ncbi:MAG: hypothetical protein BWY42_00961 [Candidatus Omnitrophica bacterium ADurb.Bin277]|nr:MAG: hypothetical protein BWY42_00961 [Candidatus Omnitrophica bacterium ADurb.Bin277]
MPASGGLLTNRTVLLAEIEAKYGVDPTPAAADNAVEVFALSIKPIVSKVERKPLRSSLSPLANSKSKWLWDIQFETELKGSGTAGTAGRLSPLFQACGMTETDNGTTSTIYTPGNPEKSCTIWIYKDGLLYKANGCRGDFEITCEAGKIPMIKWSFKGIYVTPIDSAMVTPTYEATKGQIAESVGFAISGFSGHTRSYSIKMNNQIVERYSLNSANATVGVIIGSRAPTFKCLMEAELIATEGMVTEMEADTAVDIAAVHGATAGNIMTISGTAKAQYDMITPSDESGIFMYDIEGSLSGTDDEITITNT